MVEVGYKIRILHDSASGATVKKGDVFTVIKVLPDGDIIVGGSFPWGFSPEDFEVIAHFKTGDRVLVSGQYYRDDNGVGVIEDVRISCYGVRLDTGRYAVAVPEHISYYADVEMQATKIPPQKIQQDGYEYELVGPVKPDWLVDGAWVVNVVTGEKRKVVKVGDNYDLRVNDLVAIRYHDGIKHQYRSHTPEDFKWGDWAMYEGKRVFVVNPETLTMHSMISCGEFSGALKYVPISKLTPTF